MSDLSRRSILGGLAMAGATALTCGREVGFSQETSTSPLLSHAARERATKKLIEYFGSVGLGMLRPPQGSLRHASMAHTLAGAAYSAESWDWDTLWTARGLYRLAELQRDTVMQQKYCEHAKGSLENFLDHQSAEGRIPIMMTAKDADFFNSLAVEKPNPHNQAKPVMAQIALFVAEATKDFAWLAPRFEQILRFHQSWRAGNESRIGLLVWGNDVAIGMDNDPTTFGRPDFSSANVLLNCLFYQDLRAAAELADHLNRSEDHDRINRQADELAARIQKFCWDPRDRFYYSADVQCTDVRSKWLPGLEQGMAMSWQCLPLRIQTVTGFLPLWCGLATQRQAKELIETHYLSDDRFCAAHGIRSLSKLEAMYSLTPHSGNPSNWLGPVWIISNYLVWKALQNYGFNSEATDLANKTLRLLVTDLELNGSLNEYYHPDTGAPLSHQGFMDWNLLVLEMI